MNTHNRSSRRHRGFTLVEVLVSLSLLLLLISGAFSIQIQGCRMFRRGMAETEARRNTEMSLQTIAQDIRAGRRINWTRTTSSRLSLRMPRGAISLVDGLVHTVLPLQDGARRDAYED